MGAIAFCQLQWCDDEWPNILRFWITARLLEVWRDERYNRFPIRRRVFMMLNWFPSLPPRFGISSRSSHATIKQTRMERFYYCKTNKYFSFFSQNYQSRNGGHFFVKSWMTLLKTIFPEYYPKKEGSKKSYRSLSGFTFHNYPLPFHSPLRIPIRILSDSISLKSVSRENESEKSHNSLKKRQRCLVMPLNAVVPPWLFTFRWRRITAIVGRPLPSSSSLLSVGAITVVDATRVATVRKWRVECLQSAGLVRK